MAQIRKRPDGTYEKRFTVNGKRYSVYGATRKECNERELQQRQEIANHTYTRNSTVTLDQYFKEWIEQRAQSLRENSIQRYENLYRVHISPSLGRRKVKDIERREILAFRTKLLRKLSTKTVSLIIETFHSIMQSAVMNEIMTKNPCSHLPALKKRDNEQEARDTIHRALTKEEIETFFKYAGGSWYYNAFRLMLATGIRAGECLALQWTDIDWKRGTIHIQRTITRDRNARTVIGSNTKTKKSNRYIPINREIRDILKSQHDFYMQYHGNRIISMKAPLFENARGGIPNAESMNISIRNILKRSQKAGEPIGHFSTHALRATFASMAAAQGMPLNMLKEILGHNSYAMTADLYCHLYESQSKEKMQSISIGV